MSKLQCPCCSLSFNSPFDRVDHILTIHFDEKKYLCVFCNSIFDLEKNYKAHSLANLTHSYQISSKYMVYKPSYKFSCTPTLLFTTKMIGIYLFYIFYFVGPEEGRLVTISNNY